MVQSSIQRRSLLKISAGVGPQRPGSNSLETASPSMERSGSNSLEEIGSTSVERSSRSS
jgi:hypothetical protein